MNREFRRGALIAGSILAAALALAFLAVPELAREERRPDDARGLAAWIATRPADWLGASQLSDRALDSDLPRRVELWRASYAHARMLAPLRPNADAGFVRAGLFHWYELGPQDRRLVLGVAAKMMRDPKLFGALYKPLWELTRDFAYLRRVAPRDIGSLSLLRDIAVMYGRFADYRELRAAIRAERLRAFRAQRAAGATLPELHALLPQRLDAADEAFVRAILEEMDRRAFDRAHVGGRIEDVTAFAVEHRVQPLDALRPLLNTHDVLRDVTRARLALALGDRAAATRIELTTALQGASEWLPYFLERVAFEEAHGDAAAAALYRRRATNATSTVPWRDLCGSNEICSTATRIDEGPIHFTLETSQTDEIAPYLEIHVDDALVFEGEVREPHTFHTGGPGIHRTDIRLVNRFTRAGIQRRVRLS